MALSIFKPSKEAWLEIMSVHNTFGMGGNRYEVKYLGNYLVHFLDKETGLQSNIALDRNHYDGNENSLKYISTWVDPVSEYKINDDNGDGVKEITSIQKVAGISHPDTIALLKTKYKMENGKYRAVTFSLTTDTGEQLAEVLV